MSDASHLRVERPYLVRYFILTLLLCGPLVWAFAAVRNLYPFAAWTVMMAGGDLSRGRTYYILRGETVGGEIVDVNAIELTDALSGRIFTVFSATVDNASFKVRSVHPQNLALIESAGGVERLPKGARIPELLSAYGSLYNARLLSDSQRRLRSIRLDAYRWKGGSYSGYREYIESWRQEL